MKLEVYCDGSSDGKTGGVGGWAFLLLQDSIRVHSEAGSYQNATNNVVEIFAAISALRYIKSIYFNESIPTQEASNKNSLSPLEVILYSDSKLVLGYASGEYKCKAMHLLPLYIEIRKLYKELGVRGQWVKGHSGNQYNEEVDKLANEARNNEARNVWLF